MKILNKTTIEDFPFTWVNLDFLPESNGNKVEIYLVNNEDLVEGLISMFNHLFRTIKNSIKVYNSSWWDFCLDTWNVKKDEYDYELDGKSIESKDYLIMLEESTIEIDYSGTCICNDWEKFLKVILPCIVTHQAPYSPIFYDDNYDFFFYFHHSGSIGFYYRKQNDVVEKILTIANDKYDIR